MPVADVDTGIVLEVLQQPVETADGVKPLWETRAETASRLRGRIELILQWAKVRGFRTGENPADWNTLKFTLPSKSRIYKEENFPALPHGEVGAFMADLHGREGVAARALEFAILTAARSKEVREATWSEIDLEARIWRVPSVHMKKKREHHVPLSDAVVKLLESLPRSEGNDHIFVPPMSAEFSDMALLMVIRRMHEKKLLSDGIGWIDPQQNNRVVTVHGFRATFSNWANETTSHREKAIEFALAHKLPDKVTGAYHRETMFDKRKPLMADWAQYCNIVPVSKGKNVVSARKAL
jgi:integrase